MSSYKEGGFDRKYVISKANGEPVDPEAKYFVLRYDKDPYAIMALGVYMKKVSEVNLELATDILNEIRPYIGLLDEVRPVAIEAGTAKCHKCKHKVFIPGDTHISCKKPDSFVKGDPHGVKSGWFVYPLLFDPIWMITKCRNFEAND